MLNPANGTWYMNQVTGHHCGCRIAKAFLERLKDIATKMRAMLQDVRSEARAMLKAHQKQGGLFTIEPSYAASSDLTIDDVSAAVSAKMVEPMTAPMMALSLLSNTSFLIDYGVMNLTLPRLPLMYPGDPAAQDKCLEAVDAVLPPSFLCLHCEASMGDSVVHNSVSTASDAFCFEERDPFTH
jgi:hypothetical protein